MEMMTSSTMREAFDITQEKDAVRAVRHASVGPAGDPRPPPCGRGVPWVTVVMENPYGVGGMPWLKEGVYNWDSHRWCMLQGRQGAFPAV